VTTRLGEMLTQRLVARAACWSLIACLPFWTVYLHHFLVGPNEPTGFIILDMAYYSANGREIFERGNGLGYCNPYDNDPHSPVIYFHWLQWLLGVGPAIFGLDPGLWTVFITVTAGWVTARLTWSLVSSILPDNRWKIPCYLLTMWGGGFLVIGQITLNFFNGRSLLEDLLLHDPFGGWWFLSWGRNIVLPTEAVYHALVAAAWLATVRGHWWRATAAITALAATHPFSGIEHLAILGSWLGVQSYMTKAARLPLLAVTGVTAAFLAYYFLYLPQFAAYRAVHADWSLHWVLPLASLLLAYAAVALCCGMRVFRGPFPLARHDQFFLLAAGIALVLVKHEWFLPARQPLHFTRGYVWLPLWLVGLPWLHRWIGVIAASRPVWSGRIALSLLALLAVLDNTTWLISQWQTPAGGHTDVRTSGAMRDLYRFIDSRKLTGTLLIVKPADDSWEDYNYLAATYTSTTPLLGHPFLTPNFKARCADVVAWEQSGQISGCVDQVKLLAVPRITLGSSPPLDKNCWRPVYGNTVMVLLERITQPAGRAETQ